MNVLYIEGIEFVDFDVIYLFNSGVCRSSSSKHKRYGLSFGHFGSNFSGLLLDEL